MCVAAVRMHLGNLSLAEEKFVAQICSFRQAVGHSLASRNKKKLPVHARVWAQLSSHGFFILEFQDHYSVLMVVFQLDEDLGPPQDGWIRIEPRRLQLPRELPVENTLQQTYEANRSHVIRELTSCVTKLVQVIMFGPKDLKFSIMRPTYYSTDLRGSELLRNHAQGKRGNYTKGKLC